MKIIINEKGLKKIHFIFNLFDLLRASSCRYYFGFSVIASSKEPSYQTPLISRPSV